MTAPTGRDGALLVVRPEDTAVVYTSGDRHEFDVDDLATARMASILRIRSAAAAAGSPLAVLIVEAGTVRAATIAEDHQDIGGQLDTAPAARIDVDSAGTGRVHLHGLQITVETVGDVRAAALTLLTDVVAALGHGLDVTVTDNGTTRVLRLDTGGVTLLQQPAVAPATKPRAVKAAPRPRRARGPVSAPVEIVPAPPAAAKGNEDAASAEPVLAEQTPPTAVVDEVTLEPVAQTVEAAPAVTSTDEIEAVARTGPDLPAVEDDDVSDVEVRLERDDDAAAPVDEAAAAAVAGAEDVVVQVDTLPADDDDADVVDAELVDEDTPRDQTSTGTDESPTEATTDEPAQVERPASRAAPAPAPAPEAPTEATPPALVSLEAQAASKELVTVAAVSDQDEEAVPPSRARRLLQRVRQGTTVVALVAVIAVLTVAGVSGVQATTHSDALARYALISADLEETREDVRGVLEEATALGDLSTQVAEG
ncbi:MAG: hypothetical protein REI45_14085, partial [Propionicimonas sp.]|nr:hypothetical protein [Propionicimonas sp.]